MVIIMTAIQMTMFAFETTAKTDGPVWLEDYDGNHMTAFRMDAESMVEDLNRMPSGKGSWLRSSRDSSSATSVATGGTSGTRTRR